MIKKELKQSRKILTLEALLRRLPNEHEKNKLIKDALARALAGFRGELAIDYYLAFLEKERYYILHDLRLLNHENRYFQLDVLLLSRKFLVILENKNISGTLFFDETPGQLIRTLNGKEDAFQDPLVQVQLQQRQLKMWLKKNRFPSMPILFLVTISNQSTVLKTSPHYKDFQQFVLHLAKVPFKIEHFENTITDEKLSIGELKKLTRLLLKHDQPQNPRLLESYGIAKTELLKGVHCPCCMRIPMERKRGCWICPHCLNASKDAHLKSLQDYSLLIEPTITNLQLRTFLQLSSESIAYKILASMELSQTGEKKNRQYELLSFFEKNDWG